MPQDPPSSRVPNGSRVDYELDRVAWNLPQDRPGVEDPVLSDGRPESAGDPSPAPKSKGQTEVFAKGWRSLGARIRSWLGLDRKPFAPKTSPWIVALR